MRHQILEQNLFQARTRLMLTTYLQQIGRRVLDRSMGCDGVDSLFQRDDALTVIELRRFAHNATSGPSAQTLEQDQSSATL